MWRQFVETLDHKTDPTKLWRTIKEIDGISTPKAENEAITFGGSQVSSAKQIVNYFNRQFTTSKLGRHISSRETRLVSSEIKMKSFLASGVNINGYLTKLSCFLRNNSLLISAPMSTVTLFTPEPMQANTHVCHHITTMDHPPREMKETLFTMHNQTVVPLLANTKKASLQAVHISFVKITIDNMT